MPEREKMSDAFYCIYDAIRSADDAWALYPDPEKGEEGYSNIEGRFEDFAMAMAEYILDALTDNDLENISRKDRLLAEMASLQEKKDYLVKQVDEALEKIEEIQDEIRDINTP